MAPALSRGTGATWQTACKPNSVEDGHSSRRCIAAALQQPTRRFPPCLACAWHVTRVGAPGRHASAADWGPRCEFPPYLVLLRVGFTLPPSLPPERCALTAPFHPYPAPLARRGRYVLCGTSRLAALKPRSRTLSGTLPCGVRTFLSRLSLRLAGSGRPACLHSSYLSPDWCKLLSSDWCQLSLADRDVRSIARLRVPGS